MSNNEFYDGAVDISVEDAIKALTECQIIVIAAPGNPAWYKYNYPTLEAQEYLLYDGHWRHLCRTDLCDDVCTGQCVPYDKVHAKTEEQRRRYWIKQVQLGARVSLGRFACIDAATDG